MTEPDCIRSVGLRACQGIIDAVCDARVAVRFIRADPELEQHFLFGELLLNVNESPRRILIAKRCLLELELTGEICTELRAKIAIAEESITMIDHTAMTEAFGVGRNDSRKFTEIV
jgi:hypothetical protein